MKSLGCDSFNAEYGTSVQQWNAAESGISFVQQTKLVFIFSPRTAFLAKAKERMKMACNGAFSYRLLTV